MRVLGCFNIAPEISSTPSYNLRARPTQHSEVGRQNKCRGPSHSPRQDRAWTSSPAHDRLGCKQGPVLTPHWGLDLGIPHDSPVSASASFLFPWNVAHLAAESFSSYFLSRIERFLCHFELPLSLSLQSDINIFKLCIFL